MASSRGSRHTISIHLAPIADTSALLRLVSIFHRRRATIHYIEYETFERLDASNASAARVFVTFTLANATLTSVLENLRKSVDVLAVEALEGTCTRGIGNDGICVMRFTFERERG